jgi:ribosomal protein L29
MTITSILKQLEGLSREEMIARLEATRAELQSERMKMIVVKKDNEINNKISTLNKILGVIQFGVRGSLNKSELEELRPVLQRFVQDGTFPELKFNSLYPRG